MLTALRVADFAILEAAELSLGPGLTAVTGETGAGKTILIEALAAVLGGRATERVVRAGRETAEIEAQFEGVGPTTAALLQELGIPDGDGSLVLRRVIGRQGARRCYINGRLVTLAQLRSVAAPLVDLSSQHAQHRLLEKDSHLETLDRFAGLTATRERHAQLHGEWRTLRDELTTLESRRQQQAERLDYLRFVHKELQDLDAKPGELADLQARLQRMKAAEALAKAVGEASGLLGDDGGARDRLSRAARAIGRFAHLDPKLTDLAERVREVEAQVADVAADLESYVEHVERDERQLTRLSERLDALQRAVRKYGGSEETLLARRKAVADELDGDTAELRVHELAKAVDAAAKTMRVLTNQLSQARRDAVAGLQDGVAAVVRQLGMPAARFRVALRFDATADPGPFGCDDAQFFLRANAGEAEGPLHEVASGGELSRVLLALQRACNDAVRAAGDASTVVTCIYDEADAGLSGSTGLVLGRFLGEVAERQQVLCISHLPQVAAAADTHIAVAKSEVDGRTRSDLRVLDEPSRVAELARMLGAVEGEGDTAIAHARQLLAACRKRGSTPVNPMDCSPGQG
jgi:DNA repair protein RecN (Recombination protein N)